MPDRSAAQAYKLPGTGFWLPRTFGEICSPMISGSASSDFRPTTPKLSFYAVHPEPKLFFERTNFSAKQSFVRLDRQPDQEAASAFNSPISWKSIGCRRRRRGYSSGFCRMMTLVPTGTRSYRSATSVLTSRKQPDETAVPIVSGRLVP